MYSTDGISLSFCSQNGNYASNWQKLFFFQSERSAGNPSSRVLPQSRNMHIRVAAG